MIKSEYIIKSNFEIIEHNFPEHIKEQKIYFLGDLHVGSTEFNELQWRRTKKYVGDSPVCFCGDLMDNATKTSKSNSYQATMSPLDFMFKRSN